MRGLIVAISLLVLAACAIVTVQVGSGLEHDSAAMMIKPTIDRTTNEVAKDASPTKEKE